jgi:quercetin dioxygenase-like cupin family protein
VTHYTYPPGTRFPEHSHAVDKLDAVLSRRFCMTTVGRSVILEAGDSLAVPRSAVHSTEVMGNEAVVSLDAVRSA